MHLIFFPLSPKKAFVHQGGIWQNILQPSRLLLHCTSLSVSQPVGVFGKRLPPARLAKPHLDRRAIIISYFTRIQNPLPPNPTRVSMPIFVQHSSTTFCNALSVETNHAGRSISYRLSASASSIT